VTGDSARIFVKQEAESSKNYTMLIHINLRTDTNAMKRDNESFLAYLKSTVYDSCPMLKPEREASGNQYLKLIKCK